MHLALKIFIFCLAGFVAGGEGAYALKAPKSKAKATTTKTSTKKSQKSTAVAPALSGKSQSSLRKEKQQTDKEIANTRKQISDNEKRIAKQVNRLNEIDAQIQRQESTINGLNTLIAGLSAKSAALRDTIDTISAHIGVLTHQLATSMRKDRQRRFSLNTLTYLTSASGFNESMRRLAHLRSLDRARAAKVRTLGRHRAELDARRAQLDSIERAHSSALKELAAARSVLDTRREQSATVVNDLRREGAGLNKVLQEKQQRSRQLDAELSRRIALEAQRQKEQDAKKKKTETAKPTKEKGKSKTDNTKTSNTKNESATPAPKVEGVAENRTAPTGNFAANKGSLLFPVSGKYTIVGAFGRSKHDNLSHVEVENSGIDIAASPGSQARAVFDGTVSSIFFMDGYENIVILRHGEYLTVYAGLSNIKVTKGDKVKGGASLGTIASAEGRAVLHFEVRHERTKLNPLQWVR